MYLGFDIGGTSIKYGLIDARGRIVEKAETASDISLGGRVLMDKLLEITAQYLSRRNLQGVGICTPGVVDIGVKRVIAGAGHMPGWYNIDQCREIHDRFGLPAFIENDGKAAAIGEKWAGAGKPYECFYMATFGTGLGGALVVNGSIHRGANYVAGEICGLYSAYLDSKRYAATSCLVALAQERFADETLTGRVLFEGIRKGNSEYTALLDEWCDFAALPLADIYCMVDPQAIVVGGGISAAADLFLPRLKKVINGRLETEFSNVQVNLVPALLGNDAGMMGAVHPLLVNG